MITVNWLELLPAAVGGVAVGWFAHALYRRWRPREVARAEPPFAGAGVPDRAEPAPPPVVSQGLASTGERAVSRDADTAGRVIVHLSLLGRLGNDEVGLLGYTQRGMTEALGLLQGTLAKVVARLESAKVVEVDRRHVRGESRRLKVYRLTALGESVARDLRHRKPGKDGVTGRVP